MPGVRGPRLRSAADGSAPSWAGRGGTIAHSPLGGVVLGRAAILAPSEHSPAGLFLAAILGRGGWSPLCQAAGGAAEG